MKTQKLLLLIFVGMLFAFFPVVTKAQTAKYGKIKEDVLKMKVYPKDTAAEAVVLFDKGSSKFIYSNARGFQILHVRHRRIKILSKAGYNQADVEIPIYSPVKTLGGKESVTGVKGITHELVEGEIVSHKLDKNAIFTKQYNDYVKVATFTMPNVQEGAVIEYQYTITSDFINDLRSWTFQDAIPTMWSEYQVSIPEYYEYKRFAQGYEPYFKSEEKESSTSFRVVVDHRLGERNQGEGTGRESFTVNPKTKEYLWVAKDLPAFRSESYITTPSDYLNKIEFKLVYRKMPGGVGKSIGETWAQVSSELRESEYFGRQMSRGGAVKDLVASIQSKHTDPGAQIGAALAYVRSNIKYNGISTIYSENIRKALNDKEGSIGDINLLLITILREMGHQAYPIVLSTRRHGRINPIYPDKSDFNYVVCGLIEDGKIIFLDAASGLTPAGHLPYSCLNDKGLLITDTQHQWIPLYPTKHSNHLCNFVLKMDEEGHLEGDLQVVNKGLSAYVTRSSIFSEDEETYVKEYIQNETSGINLDEFTVENLKDIYEPMKIKCKISLDTEIAGDRIYLDPVFENSLKENPFKMDERKFPVDFATPFKVNYFLTLTLPEGYVIEEKPKGIKLGLLEKAGSFTYMVGQTGNNIQVRSSLVINKPIFGAEEYKALKEFYSQVGAKLSEQLVLKRTNP